MQTTLGVSTSGWSPIGGGANGDESPFVLSAVFKSHETQKTMLYIMEACFFRDAVKRFRHVFRRPTLSGIREIGFTPETHIPVPSRCPARTNHQRYSLETEERNKRAVVNSSLSIDEGCGEPEGDIFQH